MVPARRRSTESLERDRGARPIAELGTGTLGEPGIEESFDLLGRGLRVLATQAGGLYLDPELEHLEGRKEAVSQGFCGGLLPTDAPIVVMPDGMRSEICDVVDRRRTRVPWRLLRS